MMAIFSHTSPVPTLPHAGRGVCIIRCCRDYRVRHPVSCQPRVLPPALRSQGCCTAAACPARSGMLHCCCLPCAVRDAALLLPAREGPSSSPGAQRLLHEPLPSRAAAVQARLPGPRVVCSLPGALLSGTPVQSRVPSHRVRPPCLPAAAPPAVLVLAPPADLHRLRSLGGSLRSRPLAAPLAAHVPFSNHFCYTRYPPRHKDHNVARLSDLNV